MTGRDVNFETLNAFVDNELDADRRAEVLARAARDPALARELAALSRLKATLAHGIETPELDYMVQARRNDRRKRRGFAALCLVLLVSVGVYLGAAHFGEDTKYDAGWIAAAHDGWSARPVRSTARSRSRAMSVAAVNDIYLPDLSATKLSIAHVGLVGGPAGSRATVVGYVGTRGCKVSLIVFPISERGVTSLARIDGSKFLAYGWRAGRRGFVVVASGMPEARLSVVAAGLREASLKRLPVGEETRTALARSRAASPPCHA